MGNAGHEGGRATEPDQEGCWLRGRLAVAFVFLALDRPSLATIVGVRPLLMATALGMVVALALVAVSTSKASRTPTLTTPVPTLLRILAWWCGLALAVLFVAFASWKVWGVVGLFLSIAVMVKAVSVFTYVKRSYEFRVWLPFAVILGFFIFFQSILIFLARPNIPPPMAAALNNDVAAPSAPHPVSRPHPDLFSAGFSLVFEGDVDLGGLPASFFSYTSKDGTRVDLYIAKIGFPAPPGTTDMADPSGWEIHQSQYLRAASDPTHFLVVSSTKAAVDTVAQTYFSTPATGGG